jgi:uncharacterized membrane protein
LGDSERSSDVKSNPKHRINLALGLLFALTFSILVDILISIYLLYGQQLSLVGLVLLGRHLK